MSHKTVSSGDVVLPFAYSYRLTERLHYLEGIGMAFPPLRLPEPSQHTRQVRSIGYTGKLVLYRLFSACVYPERSDGHQMAGVTLDTSFTRDTALVHVTPAQSTAPP